MPAKHTKWTAFQGPGQDFGYDGAALKKHWPRLHQGDCEPFPDAAYVKAIAGKYPELKPKAAAGDAADVLQNAWRAYHRGDFQEAVDLGVSLGRLGYNAANKAANIYATYLEKDKDRRLQIFLDAVTRSETLQRSAPGLANAWYLHAQALGRYSQGISVAKALADGLGGKVKASLEKALEVDPKHADAHIALGAFHANVVNKVGGIAWPTFGASKEAAVENFQAACLVEPGIGHRADRICERAGHALRKEQARRGDQAL